MKPGASMLRSVIQYIEEYGVVVIPGSWDAGYVLTEVNVWLRTKMLRATLVTHPSLGPEGIVGAKVNILKLTKMEGR